MHSADAPVRFFLHSYQCFDINLTSVVIMEVNMNATHLCINSEVVQLQLTKL